MQNWGTLVQPGDIVRLAWFTTSGHTTTVLGAIGSNDKINVYDNIDIVNGILTIGIHDASYWTGTDPASITIYRPSLGEVIQGIKALAIVPTTVSRASTHSCARWCSRPCRVIAARPSIRLHPR